jgi:hypothetical protein
MRWNATPPEPYVDTEKWHRWYAWRPVRIDDKWVWREYIERKRTFRISVGGNPYFHSEYRFP